MALICIYVRKFKSSYILYIFMPSCRVQGPQHTRNAPLMQHMHHMPIQCTMYQTSGVGQDAIFHELSLVLYIYTLTVIFLMIYNAI